MGAAILPETSTTESCALQWLGIDMQPMDALIIPSNIGHFIFEHYLRKGITDESRLFHGMPRL
jgi:hypothetical protein